MTEVIPDIIYYDLYEDADKKFDVFWDYIANPFNLDKTDIEAVNARTYSNYVLKLRCDLASIVAAGGTTEGSGCCIMSEDRGGICLTAGASDTEYFTHALTDLNFLNLLDSPYEIPSGTK